MTTHELKNWPEPFAALLDGTKRHEVRKNDRAFAVGDVLHLREWDPSYYDCDKDGPRLGRYTGRTADFRVTHLTPGGEYGLPADLCVMSVEPVRAPTPAAPLDLDDLERKRLDAIAACPGIAAEAIDAPYSLAIDLADAGYRMPVAVYYEASVNATPALIARVREAEAEVERMRGDARARAGDCCPDWKVARQHHICCPMMMRDAYQRAVEARAALAAKDERIAALRDGLLSACDNAEAMYTEFMSTESARLDRSMLDVGDVPDHLARLRALAGEG